MSDSLTNDTFVERGSSTTLKLIAVFAAFVVTVLVFVGYTYMRKRHADNAAAIAAAVPTPEPRKPPKALILVDEALLKAGVTTIGGTVKNTSNESLTSLSVEIELKRRKDASTETKLVALEPAALSPQQEGRYVLQVKAQDYGSARVVALRGGSDSSSIAYSSAPGMKRPLERLESKTVVVDKPKSKGGDFLNTPDNPARVP